MNECPYCGSEEYYTKQSYKGKFNNVERFDGEEVDNGHMFDGAEYKDTGKYAYCYNCKKRLFRIND